MGLSNDQNLGNSVLSVVDWDSGLGPWDSLVKSIKFSSKIYLSNKYTTSPPLVRNNKKVEVRVDRHRLISVPTLWHSSDSPEAKL